MQSLDKFNHLFSLQFPLVSSYTTPSILVNNPTHSCKWLQITPFLPTNSLYQFTWSFRPTHKQSQTNTNLSNPTQNVPLTNNHPFSLQTSPVPKTVHKYPTHSPSLCSVSFSFAHSVQFSPFSKRDKSLTVSCFGKFQSKFPQIQIQNPFHSNYLLAGFD